MSQVALNVVGRLAPSPTGALHLGNARTFLLAWLSIRQQSGTLLLRIEDIDSPRVKASAIDQTVEDLHWLGLDWDEWEQSPSQVFQQSARLPRYHEVLQRLIEDGKVYPCTCSRKDVLEAASAPHDLQLPALEGEVYPGTCKANSKMAVPNSLEKYCWRWHFGTDEMRWRDEVLGDQSATPAVQLGDFVLAKFHDNTTTPAYQLAVVVDDHDQHVTEIVRGDDLVFSTYRQLAIMQHLQWQPPRYYHVPLIVGPDGKRLAKRHGDTRLSFFRDQGISPEAIVGFLAYTAGLLEKPARLQPPDLLGQLAWDKLSTSPTVFDLKTAMPALQTLSNL